MSMNVQPIATISDRINQIRMNTAKIINEDVLPNEDTLWRFRRDGFRSARG